MKENKNIGQKEKKEGNYFFKGAVIGAFVGVVVFVVSRKHFLLFTAGGLALGGYIGSNITNSHIIAKETTSQFVNYGKQTKLQAPSSKSQISRNSKQ